MSSSLTIIKSGLMTTIQDSGRSGYSQYAIPASGSMDRKAARLAVLILNKTENAPVIECVSVAPHIQFNDHIRIVLTGANFDWQLDNKPVVLNNVIAIEAGSILSGSSAKSGMYGYIALEHDLQIEKIYNSYSTYINAGIGGYKGRPLQKGDHLEWIEDKESTSNPKVIYFNKGPEYEWLTIEAKTQVIASSFTIDKDSNRMGARLRGPNLECNAYQLEDSCPIFPGFIQLTPSGQLIIVLYDGQVTGGYPRIAYLNENEINKFVRLKIGSQFNFKLIV